MKSGKVILRIQKDGEKNYIDLDVSKGIQNSFYQEVVSVKKEGDQTKMTFLSQIRDKLVMTPDLDSMLNDS